MYLVMHTAVIVSFVIFYSSNHFFNATPSLLSAIILIFLNLEYPLALMIELGDEYHILTYSPD